MFSLKSLVLLPLIYLCFKWTIFVFDILYMTQGFFKESRMLLILLTNFINSCRCRAGKQNVSRDFIHMIKADLAEVELKPTDKCNNKFGRGKKNAIML